MLSSAYWPSEGSAAVLDQTVGELLRSAVERAPDLPALVEGVPDPAQRRRWTYAELLEQSETAAGP